MDEQRKRFLEMESPGGDAGKTVEMMTKASEYQVNLAAKPSGRIHGD